MLTGGARVEWAVFLDRDGVICRNRADYVKAWSEFEWLPGSREAIARLTAAGVPVLVVSNQSAIGRGLTTMGAVENLHKQMVRCFRESGGDIKAVYYCPHRPEDNCSCRKPRPGMLLAASTEHAVDLSRSFIVGDSWSDIAAGKQAGVKTVLVTTSRSEEECLCDNNGQIWAPDHVVAGLGEAVDLILTISGQKAR
jgi:histidinol-phosphate phosphatase family protein